MNGNSREVFYEVDDIVVIMCLSSIFLSVSWAFLPRNVQLSYDFFFLVTFSIP